MGERHCIPQMTGIQSCCRHVCDRFSNTVRSIRTQCSLALFQSLVAIRHSTWQEIVPTITCDPFTWFLALLNNKKGVICFNSSQQVDRQTEPSMYSIKRDSFADLSWLIDQFASSAVLVRTVFSWVLGTNRCVSIKLWGTIPLRGTRSKESRVVL